MNDENRRRQLEGAERKRDAVDLYTDGESTAEIADRLSVARGTVNRYLREARAEANGQAVDLIEAWRGKSLAIVDAVIASQWAGMVEGDPRAAMVVLKATEQACKLLGVEPAKGGELTAEEIQRIRANATPEEVRRLRGLIDRPAELESMARGILARVGG